MNLLNSKIEKRFIKSIIIFYLSFGISLQSFSWDVDFSRRVNESTTKKNDFLPWPSSQKPEDQSFSEASLKKMIISLEEGQIISILQTDEGFIPSTLRLKKDSLYKIHVVNVNEKFKNASFILDSFGLSFGIYFGKPKSFELVPKIEGSFQFISPESGAQGKIIVISGNDNAAPLAAVMNHEAKK